MPLTNDERVGQALDLLVQGAQPYIERELTAAYGDRWQDSVHAALRAHRDTTYAKGDGLRWDAHLVLLVMWDHWNSVFRLKLGPVERSLVNELRDSRNRWAHQRGFGFDDTYRTLDTIRRLLQAMGAKEAADAARHKEDVLRGHYSELTQSEVRHASKRNGRMWFVVGCLVCYLAIIISTVINFRLTQSSITFAMLMGIVFGYLIIRRLCTADVQDQIHECGRCRRIVYREVCPYCG